MINREDSALIARERQNRGPASGPAVNAPTKLAQTKTAAEHRGSKSPLRAGQAKPDR